MLKNKKVLFIGPIFHDYHLLIIKSLKSMGAHPFFYPERSYGVDFKLINNFFNKHLENHQRKHYNKLLKRIKDQEFDYLFVVRGYMIPSDFLIEFKRLNPNSKLIMYQWDSNKANPFAHLLRHFDYSYSFDFEDCNAFMPLKYLPLFYSDDVVTAIGDKTESIYDFFFMGWFFPERYQAVVKFKEYAAKNGFSLKAFLYMPLSSYIKECIKGKRPDMTIVSLKPMIRTDYLNFLRRSRVMIDVSNPNQTGLAMRVIEALASKTKILTNNHKIKDDPEIYSVDYIAFLDEKKPDVDPHFIESEMGKQNDNLLSLDKWLKRIFLN